MDDVLTTVREAIRRRRPLSFAYLKLEKTPERRIGHPHILFAGPSGRLSVLVLQISGATDSDQPLPGWRQFELEHLSDIQVLKDEAPFAVQPDFQRNDARYHRAIEAVVPCEASVKVEKR